MTHLSKGFLFLSVVHLEKLPNLQSLRLSFSQVTAEGVAVLQRGLSKTKIIVK